MGDRRPEKKRYKTFVHLPAGKGRFVANKEETRAKNQEKRLKKSGDGRPETEDKK